MKVYRIHLAGGWLVRRGSPSPMFNVGNPMTNKEYQIFISALSALTALGGAELNIDVQ